MGIIGGFELVERSVYEVEVVDVCSIRDDFDARLRSAGKAECAD